MTDPVDDLAPDAASLPAPRPATSQPGGRVPAVPLVPFEEAYGGRPPFRSAGKTTLTGRLLPLLEQLSGYTRARFRTDATAGLTVAALAVPASMAYAEIAGLPVTAGLYSLLLPLAAYALLGSTSWMVVGPESTIALLVASGLGSLAVSGTTEYATLGAALALLVGGLYLAARLLRLGWIANYFSQAVLVGYVTGVATVIVLGQLGKLLGISSGYDNPLVKASDVLVHVPDANAATVAVAAGCLLLLVGLRLLWPRFPAPLLVVVVSIALSWWLDLAGHGVAVAGNVPAGLPDLALPRVGDGQWAQLLGVAGAVFLVGYSDSILTSRSLAAQRGETVDADQELLAFSAANAAAGLTQGMPIGTTGSRTAVNLSMGATSQVVGLVSAGAVAVVVVALTEPVQYLPAATLAAIIVTGAVRLIDPDQWKELARASRVEIAIAALTTLAVINLGVLTALAAAVLLSLLDVIRRIARPNDAVLGWSAGDVRYADVSSRTDASVTPGLVVYRFSDRLFFANVHFFKRRAWAAVDAAPQPVRYLILDVESIPDLDASAATGLRELHTALRDRHVGLAVARATDALMATMDRLGLVGLFGADRCYPTVGAAVEDLEYARGS